MSDVSYQILGGVVLHEEKDVCPAVRDPLPEPVRLQQHIQQIQR